MTENNELRAVVLAALMVFSVFGGTIAFAGAASAVPIDRSGNGSFDYFTSNSTGTVAVDGTVFQGEEDITIQGGITPETYSRTGGDNEGVPLEIPVPQDAPTGSYSDGTNTITVVEPRITTFDVNNDQGEDVNGGVLVADPGAEVVVEYNYAIADDIELTVEDESGVDVTQEILAGGETAVRSGLDTRPSASLARPGIDQNESVVFDIDSTAVDEGEYTFTVAGTEDFDFDGATQTTTVEIVTSQAATLNLGSTDVVQGENVDFTVEDTAEGNFHAVAIQSEDFRDGIDADQANSIFRNVGDTVDFGLVDNGSSPVVLTQSQRNSIQAQVNADNDIDEVAELTDYAFAIVEIDGGSGVGSIETQFLDDSSVTVDVFESNSSVTYLDTDQNHNTNIGVFSSVAESDDDEDIEIDEGTVSLSEPTGTYVTGNEVTVNGTANEGADDVAIYVRDQGDYELAQIDGSPTITVDGDNTFDEEDVQLGFGSTASNEQGNNILSLPGTYRIGVIVAQDAAIDSPGPDNSLTTSEFNGGISSTESVVVTDTELTGSFVTYNGQVADDDGTIDLNGTAAGKDGSEIVVAFVDSRGNTVADTVSVDSDSTFEREDFDISSLSQGTVSAHLISSGRDGVFGEDASNNFDDADGTASFIDTGLSGTGDQVRSSILANTVDDTASDDLIVTETFRLSDGLTTVETVTSPVEGNGTIEVTGQTNRRADDNTITAELLDQGDNSVTLSSTDQWGTDGAYSVNISLDGVQPGEYVVEVDDGDNTDRASVEVVEQVDEEETPTTATPEPDTSTPTPTPTPEPDTPTPTEEPADDTETDTPSTDAGTPGFGIVVALTALIAAALLAVRRTN